MDATVNQRDLAQALRMVRPAVGRSATVPTKPGRFAPHGVDREMQSYVVMPLHPPHTPHGRGAM